MSQDDVSQAFKEEAYELLAELETALLELEENPGDDDTVNRVFRAMHTIKGSGAMFGFDDIATFTHEVENVFDRVRNNEIPVTKELLNLTLSARDYILDLLDGSDTGEGVDLARAETIVSGLKGLMPGEANAPEETPVEAPVEAPVETPRPETKSLGEEAAETAVYRIRFKPEKDIFLTGANPLSLLNELKGLGRSTVIVHTEEIPSLVDYDPDHCYVWWDIILIAAESLNTVKDVFIFVEDDCELEIEVISKEGVLDFDSASGKLGEILMERGDLTAEDLKKVLGEQKKLGEILTSSGVVTGEQVRSALAEQEMVREVKAVKQKKELASSIRVGADKLDYLVDLVGELVIVQARITQVAGDKKDHDLIALAEELERLSDELRDNTMGIRMLPIGTTFNKFRRMVRDLSAELGKKIELLTEGADTELDKTVIERLNDPLVHLLRNTIDHGIEPPSERSSHGKPETGTVLLSAEHSGGEVLIKITDDGAGMDPGKIRAKAEERGLIAPDAELSDKECFALIFDPGFSMAKKVTSVSGRGVGMDVVKRGIEGLRGIVDIQSEKGRGTTITIRLPLTLAIIEGLQIKVGGEFYVIPLSLVEECVELAQDNGSSPDTQQILNLRGEIVPYIRLRDWFEISGEAPDIEQIVVTGVDERRIGIVVDHVIGEHQTVIKNLGKVYRNVEGLSGATIKGDGTMALILDVPRLVGSVIETQR